MKVAEVIIAVGAAAMLAQCVNEKTQEGIFQRPC